MKHIIPLLSLCLSTLFCVNITLHANKDGCTETAQECVCKNTGIKGYCFPGSMDQSGGLYCNCESDVLEMDEVLENIVRMFIKGEMRNTTNVYPKTLRILKTLEKELGKHPTAEDFKQPSIKKHLKTLKLALEAEGSIAAFYTQDSSYCKLPGDSCVCYTKKHQGGGLYEGVCGINRTYRPGEIYCHCD